MLCTIHGRTPHWPVRDHLLHFQVEGGLGRTAVSLFISLFNCLSIFTMHQTKLTLVPKTHGASLSSTKPAKPVLKQATIHDMARVTSRRKIQDTQRVLIDQLATPGQLIKSMELIKDTYWTLELVQETKIGRACHKLRKHSDARVRTMAEEICHDMFNKVKAQQAKQAQPKLYVKHSRLIEEQRERNQNRLCMAAEAAEDSQIANVLAIEDACFIKHQYTPNQKEYKRLVHELLADLKSDSRFRERVLCGEITPQFIVENARYTWRSPRTAEDLKSK